MDKSDLARIKDTIEHELVQELSKPLIILIAAVVVLTIGLYFGYGIRTVEATGVCSEEVNICHGLPLGDSCVGFERNDTFYDSADQCSEYDHIVHSCEGGVIDYVEEDSMEDVQVADRTCSEWAEIYDIEVE